MRLLTVGYGAAGTIFRGRLVLRSKSLLKLLGLESLLRFFDRSSIFGLFHDLVHIVHSAAMPAPVPEREFLLFLWGWRQALLVSNIMSVRDSVGEAVIIATQVDSATIVFIICNDSAKLLEWIAGIVKAVIVGGWIK